MAVGRSLDTVQADWVSEIYQAFLSRAWCDTPTGIPAEAARLIAKYGWAATIWRNRTSQIRKWLTFCDEDDRCPLPAEEGDVLAYIGYLSLEGRLSSVSLPHSITAVSKYHELHHVRSPTKTPLVRTPMAAYSRRQDSNIRLVYIRVGYPARLLKHIVDLGMSFSSVKDIGNCATVVFSFIFYCRATSVRMVRPEDVTFHPT